MAISSSKDFVVFPNDNSGRVYVNEQAFTSSGTWTPPANVSYAQVVLVGAGGGGGGGSSYVAGGGGGGGAVVVQNVQVTGGVPYSINIGAGGQGGLGSQYSATEVTSTLPGANGGATTFGSTTVFNYLNNSDFSLNMTGWTPALILRGASGVSGASSITVFPNALGIVPGMQVANQTGSGIPSNTYVTTVSGNTVNLSAALTATVGETISFDAGQNTLALSEVMYPNITAVGGSSIISSNYTVNVPGAPDGQVAEIATNEQIFSNNILPPRFSQLEDPTLVSGSLISVQGTNPATIAITSSGIPTKLTEMIAGFVMNATGANGATTITLDNPTVVQVGMFLIGTGFASGTVITSVSGNSTAGYVFTISNALTQVLSTSSVTVSYSGTAGINGLNAITGSAVSTSNPTWMNFSTIASASSITTNATSTNGGYSGVPYIPGQTYTMSAYVSASANVSTTTPILFQLRSTGASYGAATAVSYLGGTTSGTTSSIDAGTANGFFVRQATPSALTNYGGTISVAATGTSGAGSITVTSATGIFVGMTVTGSNIQSNTTVSSVSGTTIGLSLTTSGPVASTITFAQPSGVQVLGSNVTVGQNGWRRISATFTTPSFATATANGAYGYGSTPQFIYPSIVIQQPSTTFWFDNVQLEMGNNTTSFSPPIYSQKAALAVTSAVTNGNNIEISSVPNRVTAGSTYSASMYIIGSSTSNQYRPVNAFIEYLDADYNVLTRFTGTALPMAITGALTSSQMSTSYVSPPMAVPTRLGVVGQVAPTGTLYARIGFSVYQGAQNTSTTYQMFAPQLEPGASVTAYKKVDNVTYFWAGQSGNSPVISSYSVIAEGGGGGGTYNTNNYQWQYGLQGANNGGHAAYNSSGAAYITLAGGGGGSWLPGGNAVITTPTPSASTTYQFQAGQTNVSTGSYVFDTMPMRGSAGGYATYNLYTGANSSVGMFGQAGDGGAGTVISGINSGAPTGVPMGGGGGGSGWTNSASVGYVFSGRGSGGGGRGGNSYLIDQQNNTMFYSRGMDAIQNTGGGGGGGGTNAGNYWAASPITHTSASAAIAYESASSGDAYKWQGLYNINVVASSASAIFASYMLRGTIQDVGNAKANTVWQSFSILPRTALYFPNIAARLTTAPNGVTSPQFAGLTKQVRPTVRWKDQNNNIIREDRPIYNIVFSAVNTITYLGPTGSTAGTWQTLEAPANAYYFDVCWEYLYMDAGDVVDVDFAAGLGYFGYKSNGGNGADGYALVRWFDKAVFYS